MKRSIPVKGLLIFSAVLLLSSCVSKKRYDEEIGNLTRDYTERISILNDTINSDKELITRLNLRLAERKGENNALTAMQDKLQGRIDDLEKEIESLNDQAASNQQSMDVALRDKQAEVAEKEAMLDEIAAYLQEREKAMTELETAARDSLQAFEQEQWIVETGNGEVAIVVMSDYIFRTNSTSRLSTNGGEILEKISQILYNYPNVLINVIGHTDDKSPGSRAADNWQYSALRASTVVRYLTKELELSPNLVLASGKGEYAPRSSNETKEGRAQNRRIEIVVSNRQSSLIRSIQRKLSE